MSDTGKIVHHYTPAGVVKVEGETHKSWGTEEHYEEAKQRLSTDPAHPVTDESFLTSVVYSLAWDLKGASANIEGIYCDQWCGVKASGQEHDNSFIPSPKEDAEPFQTFVQCDRPEWGVAATWLAFVEKFGLQEDS